MAKADDRQVDTVRCAMLCPLSRACPFPKHTQSDKEAKLTARYFCDQKEQVSLCVRVHCIKGAHALHGVSLCACVCRVILPHAPLGVCDWGTDVCEGRRGRREGGDVLLVECLCAFVWWMKRSQEAAVAPDDSAALHSDYITAAAAPSFNHFRHGVPKF